MRAIGPTAPKFGPKQTRSNKPRDVGIGGGPPRGGGMPATGQDPGVKGPKAATANNDARSSRGTEKHSEVVNKTSLKGNDHGNVKGQDPGGKESPGLKREDVGGYNPNGNRHGGHDGKMHLLGKHGRHDSVKGHEHDGYKHTSEDR